jgi:hypothetical protein
MFGPNFHGAFNTSPSVGSTSFSPVFPPAGRLGLLSRAARSASRRAARGRAAARALDVRQRGEQGGRLGQRPARWVRSGRAC